jgi:hypothetical protein
MRMIVGIIGTGTAMFIGSAVGVAIGMTVGTHFMGMVLKSTMIEVKKKMQEDDDPLERLTEKLRAQRAEALAGRPTL